MRKFILGVGAQKAGTTWLFSQLAAQAGFRMPAVTQLHVLDAIFLADCLPFRRRILRGMAEILHRAPDDFEKYFISKKFHMLLDFDAYFRYFDRLIDTESGFSCDITPSYAGFPAEAFGLVRAKFQNLNIEPYAVFILREPVSQIESAVRMRLRKEGGLDGISATDMADRLRAASGAANDRLRVSYRKTVARLRAHFPDDRLFIGFYETLFTQPELSRLAATLTLSAAQFRPDHYYNTTAKAFRYPKALIEELRRNYDDEYAFAIETLGLDAALWEHSRAALCE